VLHDPTDPQAVQDWFAQLRVECPFWSLCREQYATVFHWQLMVRPVAGPTGTGGDLFRQGRPLHYALRFKRDGWQFRPPGVVFSDNVLRAVLLEGYRLHLARGAAPDSWSTLVPEPRTGDSDEDSLPQELAAAIEDHGELTRLIWERDMARSGAPRRRAQQELDNWLREHGAVPKRGSKASLPGAKAFIHKLGRECRKFVRLFQGAVSHELTTGVGDKLAAWGVVNDPGDWGRRLAFPFLSDREFNFLRTEATGTSVDLSAVRLIHSRVAPLQDLGTIADHAFGDYFRTKYRSQLRSNPILNDTVF